MWNPFKTYKVVCRQRQKVYRYEGKGSKICNEFSHLLNGYKPTSYKDLIRFLREETKTNPFGEWSYSNK